MAQLVARLVRNEKVRGSNPLSSTAAANQRIMHKQHDQQRYVLIPAEYVPDAVIRYRVGDETAEPHGDCRKRPYVLSALRRTLGSCL